MSNGNVAKPGLRKVQASLSDRLTGLEQGIARMLFGVNQRFQGTDQRLGALEETSEALVELQGKEDVQAYVNASRAEKAKAASEQEKNSLEEAIKDGYVSTSETVEERSLIVGRYLDKNGEVIEPGRTQLVMPGVQEQFRALLLGKQVGLSLDLPDGGKFELQAIYSVDEEKAKVVMEAKQKAAAEAAATAAAQTAAKDEAKDTAPAAAEAPAQTTAETATDATASAAAPASENA